MHLSSIRLRGFKSFPEPVEVRLEPGVAVVVGPNGSGKSNVADALVWAAGSLAPSELRAEKPDDVLYAGSGGRGPVDFCEVELLFDNTDGEGPIDYSELSIARRLHRGGEGQYLVNRTPVRRIDLVELLADLGLGGSMHSIIGQGRVEEILASRPEERRNFIEEAAGLGRFKRRKHRAELKLTRVATQVERARDVEEEVRKRLRPLALQASAAERAEKLRGEIAALRARVAQLDLVALEERLTESEGRLRSRKRESGLRCRWSTSIQVGSARLPQRWGVAPRHSSRPTSAPRWRSSNAPAPQGSAASSCSSAATRRSSYAGCPWCRRRSCCPLRSRLSHPRDSGGIRNAVSSGSPARPRRPSGSSSKRAGAHSRQRSTSSRRVPPRRSLPVRTRSRRTARRRHSYG